MHRSSAFVRSALARLRTTLLALALTSGAGVALAHATIVFVELEPDPNPAPVGEPFELGLTMVDPTQLPVEDAVVRIELTPAEGGEVTRAEFSEVAPGRYRTTVALPEAGDYRALLRDQTFRQEEARQTVTLTVGGDAPIEPVEFVFPPTATGERNIVLWLAWLVGVPLVVGMVVTVLVLVRGGDAETPAPADDG